MRYLAAGASPEDVGFSDFQKLWGGLRCVRFACLEEGSGRSRWVGVLADEEPEMAGECYLGTHVVRQPSGLDSIHIAERSVDGGDDNIRFQRNHLGHPLWAITGVAGMIHSDSIYFQNDAYRIWLALTVICVDRLC